MHGAWGVIFWILRLRLRHNETRPLVARFDHVLRSAIPDTPSVVVASARNLFTLLTQTARLLYINGICLPFYASPVQSILVKVFKISRPCPFFLSELELLSGFSILFFLFCNALFYTVGYFRSNKDWGRYLMNEEYLFFSVDRYIWALMYSSAVYGTRL